MIPISKVQIWAPIAFFFSRPIQAGLLPTSPLEFRFEMHACLVLLDLRCEAILAPICKATAIWTCRFVMVCKPDGSNLLECLDYEQGCTVKNMSSVSGAFYLAVYSLSASLIRESGEKNCYVARTISFCLRMPLLRLIHNSNIINNQLSS